MPSWPADAPPEPPGQMPVSAFDIQALYAPGRPSPILVGGDSDAGGRDDVAGDVAGSVAAACARQDEHQGDTYGLGSQIGDPMTLPAESSTGSGGGAFYDPPRDY